MKMRAKLILILSFFLLNLPEAQISPSAREIGLGNSTVASTEDVNSIFVNPASLSLVNSTEISLFYSPSPFGVKELANGFFAANYNFNYFSVGAGFSTFGFELYKQNGIYLSFSKEIYKNIFIGLTSEYRFLNIQNYGETTSILFNFGLLTNLTPEFKIGFNILNFTNSSYTNSENQIPIIYNFGFSYNFINDFSFSAAIEKEIDFPISSRFGLEYSVFNFFDLRIGVKNQPNSFSGGFGVEYSFLKIDYAFFTNEFLPITHQIGLIISLKQLQ